MGDYVFRLKMAGDFFFIFGVVLSIIAAIFVFTFSVPVGIIVGIAGGVLSWCMCTLFYGISKVLDEFYKSDSGESDDVNNEDNT